MKRSARVVERAGGVTAWAEDGNLTVLAFGPLPEVAKARLGLRCRALGFEVCFGSAPSEDPPPGGSPISLAA